MTADDPAAAIAALFASEGAAEYFGEPVTQAEHMLQAAGLAEQDHAARSLVAAAPTPRAASSPRRLSTGRRRCAD
jgi:predicted HD phosphohydrolase